MRNTKWIVDGLNTGDMFDDISAKTLKELKAFVTCAVLLAKLVDDTSCIVHRKYFTVVRLKKGGYLNISYKAV